MSKEVKDEVKKDIKKDIKKETKKEVKSDKDRIVELEAKLEEALSKYLYTLAELRDLHKTYQKENATSIKYVTYDLMLELLPLYDIFSMVLENKNVPSEVSAYFQGFQLVFNKFSQILEDNGVSEIKAKSGDKFDHNVHNGLESIEVEDEELDNTINEVLLRGYKINDKVLRPTSVKVNTIKKEVEDLIEEVSEEGSDVEGVLPSQEKFVEADYCFQEEKEEEKVMNGNKGE